MSAMTLTKEELQSIIKYIYTEIYDIFNITSKKCGRKRMLAAKTLARHLINNSYSNATITSLADYEESTSVLVSDCFKLDDPILPCIPYEYPDEWEEFLYRLFNVWDL